MGDAQLAGRGSSSRGQQVVVARSCSVRSPARPLGLDAALAKDVTQPALGV